MAKVLAVKSLLAGLLALSIVAPVLSADIYDIDPEHTFSIFQYNHWGLSLQHGRFDSTTGYIEVDPESNTTSIQIEIDANSINTGSDALDKMLRSSNFFDTENYPRILFKSSRVQFDGESMTQVDGDLIIKDIARPVVLKLDHYHCRFMPLYAGARTCGANARTQILRSDFNLGRFTPFVGDEVDLFITVEAIRRNPPPPPPAE